MTQTPAAITARLNHKRLETAAGLLHNAATWSGRFVDADMAIEYRKAADLVEQASLIIKAIQESQS